MIELTDRNLELSAFPRRLMPVYIEARSYPYLDSDRPFSSKGVYQQVDLGGGRLVSTGAVDLWWISSGIQSTKCISSFSASSYRLRFPNVKARLIILAHWIIQKHGKLQVWPFSLFFLPLCIASWHDPTGPDFKALMSSSLFG